MHRGQSCTGHDVGEVGTQIGVNDRRTHDVGEVRHGFVGNVADIKDTGLLAFHEEHRLILHGHGDRAAHNHFPGAFHRKPALRDLKLNVHIGLLGGRREENLRGVRHFKRGVL